MTKNSDELRNEKKARDIADLFKTAKELSILCGILVSIIILNPGEFIPIMWPNEFEAKGILTRYLGFSEDERCKKFVEHETYLTDKLIDRKLIIEEKVRRSEEKKSKFMFKQLYDKNVKVSELKLDAKEIRGLLKLSALTRVQLDERKKQFDQQSQNFQPASLFCNFDSTTRNDVDHNDFQVVDTSLSLLVGRGIKRGRND
ncbi:agamous-like MADS-box protein AGL90 [Solanum tuberosum]|uniref:Type I MADS box transcription factor n=1 Tax=Solanum tuberosum TaxID=4113 RepID=M1DNI4_SOLTU|nr:PREDICTED: agamous-like MADS-box protein AGL90 [Solanum tuberosum]